VDPSTSNEPELDTPAEYLAGQDARERYEEDAPAPGFQWWAGQPFPARPGPVVWRPVCARPNRERTVWCDRTAEHAGGCSWALVDEGYLRGIRNILSGMAGFDQELPGFDRPTVQKLRRFGREMLNHAAERLSR
jgi:hypothetical protein